jgi:hypothetical protein
MSNRARHLSLAPPVFAAFDSGRVRREAQAWGITEDEQIRNRVAFEHVGVAYPAQTRAEAIEVVQRVLAEAGAVEARTRSSTEYLVYRIWLGHIFPPAATAYSEPDPNQLRTRP